MKDEFINKVTLEYLVSPSVKQKLNYKPVDIKKEVRFYKNRILSLTRELVTKKEAPCLDIKNAFEHYAISCIEYFKSLDTNDSIQENYKDFDSFIDCSFADIDIDIDISYNELSLEEADKLFMRKIPVTMDAFVKKTSFKKPIFLPQQHDINYHDPTFKMKGVLNMNKNNLNNTYEGKNKIQSSEVILEDKN